MYVGVNFLFSKLNTITSCPFISFMSLLRGEYQDISLEFVFWLHLLACHLHSCSSDGISSGSEGGTLSAESLADLVALLYPPSPLLLLPHMLPVAVRLACCLPSASSSSSTSNLQLLCQTLGFFQVRWLLCYLNRFLTS